MVGDSFTDDEMQALARTFRDPQSAAQLLDEAGFPPTRHPQFANAEVYWWQVNEQLRAGVLQDGRRRILRVACERYPANQAFASGARRDPLPTPRPGPSQASPDHRRAHRPLWRRGVLAKTWVRLAVAGGTTVAVLASAFALALIVLNDGDEPVLRQPVNQAGPNPFMQPVGQDTQVMPVTSHQGGVVSSDTTGLYGGTRDNASCDREKMLEYLKANQDLLAAWTDVLDVNPVDIDTFVNSLTPVVLRTDTLVTNHGYADGKVTAFQAVLQAGTAVLIDRNGTPVVRCACGNPLTEPRINPATAKDADVGGTSWEGFSTNNVTEIRRFVVPAETFVIKDVRTDVPFVRDSGSAGSGDREFVPAGDMDWRNTTYRVDCAAGTTFEVSNGIGEATHEGRTYTLKVDNVAVGDLAGYSPSSAEVAVFLTCGERASPTVRQLLYVFRDGPNVLDTPGPPDNGARPATTFAADQLEVRDRLLATAAHYPRTDGAGGTELLPVRFLWDGQRFVPTDATRSPAPSDSPGKADVNLSGIWQGTVVITEPIDTEVPFTLELRQDGSALTGTIRAEISECGLSGSSIEGSVDGDSVRFDLIGSELRTSFTGTVSGDRISGTGSSDCYQGEGTWTVTRVG